ncbi:MAG: hypothetical protein CL940_09815 [Deltaproteobacteria bacterium]|nr:hypothetical protein [Deltaproteobacteria bacterium]
MPMSACFCLGPQYKQVKTKLGITEKDACGDCLCTCFCHSCAQCRVLRELKQHLAGALKIKGETLKARRGVLAASVRQEQAAAASADTSIFVTPEHLEWPFEGEYWRDELGSYRYDISSRCGVEAP